MAREQYRNLSAETTRFLFRENPNRPLFSGDGLSKPGDFDGGRPRDFFNRAGARQPGGGGGAAGGTVVEDKPLLGSRLDVAGDLADVTRPRTVPGFVPVPGPPGLDPASPSDPSTPGGTPIETPGGTPIETPGGTPIETPGGTPIETPGGTPIETPGGTPIETPGGTPIETPGGTPIETPGGTPIETPGGTPIETPGGTPIETPGGTPIETPGGTPIETPGGTPIETPGGTPIETPGGTPIETPGGTPIETPTETPIETPGDEPAPAPAPQPEPAPQPAPGPTLTAPADDVPPRVDTPPARPRVPKETPAIGESPLEPAPRPEGESYPRRIAHRETLEYSYDPETREYSARVVETTRPVVTGWDRTPPQTDEREVRSWGVSPSDNGVQAEQRTDAATMPKHIASALAEESERTGERASKTHRYQFDYDLDTRKLSSSRDAVLSETERMAQDRRFAANLQKAQEAERRSRSRQREGRPLKSGRRHKDDAGPTRLPEIYISYS